MPRSKKILHEKDPIPNEKNLTIDILIVGGGLIGATLALALANKGHRLLLVDSHSFQEKTDSSFDSRSLALSPASFRILLGLEIWPELEQEATPIKTIHVSEQSRFGATRLQAKKNESLGYVVEIQTIYNALYKKLNQQSILAPAQVVSIDTNKKEVVVQTQNGELTIQTQMIVAADGTHSLLRPQSGLEATIKDYKQFAITANVGLARSHHNRAFERFTASGPIALLPLTNNRASLVWASSAEETTRLFELSDSLFLKELQQAFGYKLGKFIQLGKRTFFPLKHVSMPKKIAWPYVFIGNAAHTLHPIAGQGFNLGLRDVASLAECILKYGINETMLERYEAMRRHDQNAIQLFTDNLVRIFTSKMPGVGLIRNLGLLSIELFPLFKNTLTHYAGGFGGEPCDLVCNIPLPKGVEHE